MITPTAVDKLRRLEVRVAQLEDRLDLLRRRTKESLTAAANVAKCLTLYAAIYLIVRWYESNSLEGERRRGHR